MESNLPIFYLALLLIFLSGAGVVILRQIIRNRSTEKAFSQLRNKLSKESGTAQEYYELGTIFLRKKLFVQAVNAFQKSLRAKDLVPGEDTALVYNGLGYAHFAQEQYDLAIRQYKEALKAKPDYVTAHNNLGHAYERKKLTMQALEAYEESLKLDPNNKTAKQRAESLRKRVTTTV